MRGLPPIHVAPTDAGSDIATDNEAEAVQPTKKGPRTKPRPSVNTFDCVEVSAEYLSDYLRALAWHPQRVLQAPVHSLQPRPKSWARRKWIVPARVFRTIPLIGARHQANSLNRDRLHPRAQCIVRKRVSQFVLVLSIYVRSFCTPSNYSNHTIPDCIFGPLHEASCSMRGETTGKPNRFRTMG